MSFLVFLFSQLHPVFQVKFWLTKSGHLSLILVNGSHMIVTVSPAA